MFVIISEARKPIYYIGPDVHKKNTQACVKDETGGIIVNENFLSNSTASKTAKVL